MNQQDYKTKINVKLSVGQYQLLYNLISDADDRGYHQGQFRYPSIDTQTFDNMFEAVCNAMEEHRV